MRYRVQFYYSDGEPGGCWCEVNAKSEEQALELAEYWLMCMYPNIYEKVRTGSRKCFAVLE